MIEEAVEIKIGDPNIRRFLVPCQYCREPQERSVPYKKITCFKCKTARRKVVAIGRRVMTFSCVLPSCGVEVKRYRIPGRSNNFFCSPDHYKEGRRLGLVKRPKRALSRTVFPAGVVYRNGFYYRTCLGCHREVPSKNKDSAVWASRKGRVCRKCSSFRHKCNG